MPRKKPNRRKEDNGAQLHAPMIAVLVLLAVIFVSFLYLGGRCENLGSRIKAMEIDIESIHVRVLTEEMKWERMKSPKVIRVYLNKHDLDMSWPGNERIYRIPMNKRRAFDPPEAQPDGTPVYNLARQDRRETRYD
jgi:hypothetical protein